MRAFGPFTLLEPLVAGGMGETWLARAEALPHVAGLCLVKTIRRALSSERETIERFLDEARVMILLDHPNVCRLLDAGEVDGTRYLALELVEGLDGKRLFEGTAAGGGVPLDAALALSIGALRGLAAAHAARHPATGAPLGVVHRDVSPHNLMADRHGVARVIDFGLAASTEKRTRTEAGVVMGKLAYMAPEHARGEPLDARADTFALAVVAYELITGDRYYGGLRDDEIWRRVGVGDHVPRRLDAVPADVRAALAAALVRDPAERATCAQLADALSAIAERRGLRDGWRTLAALVAAHGAETLARIDAARVAAATIPPSTAAPDGPRTVSLMLSDVAALAAVAQRAATQVAPANDASPPPRDDEEKTLSAAAPDERLEAIAARARADAARLRGLDDGAPPTIATAAHDDAPRTIPVAAPLTMRALDLPVEARADEAPEAPSPAAEPPTLIAAPAIAAGAARPSRRGVLVAASIVVALLIGGALALVLR